MAQIMLGIDPNAKPQIPNNISQTNITQVVDELEPAHAKINKQHKQGLTSTAIYLAVFIAWLGLLSMFVG